LFLRRLGTCPHPVHAVVVPYGNPVVSRSSGFLAPSAAIAPSTRTCRPSLPSCLLLTSFWLNTHLPIH
jgi:hypothetical protein